MVHELTGEAARTIEEEILTGSNGLSNILTCWSVGDGDDGTSFKNREGDKSERQVKAILRKGH